jgi:hypothetical protein
MHTQFPEGPIDRWLASYKESRRSLLDSDPEFARWLDEEYVPLAGGWQY